MAIFLQKGKKPQDYGFTGTWVQTYMSLTSPKGNAIDIKDGLDQKNGTLQIYPVNKTIAQTWTAQAWATSPKTDVTLLLWICVS